MNRKQALGWLGVILLLGVPMVYALYSGAFDDDTWTIHEMKADIYYVGPDTLSTYIQSVVSAGAGSNISVAEKILYVNAGTYYAVDGLTGAVTSGGDFDVLFTTVLAACVDGDTIYIKNGDYYVNAEITVNKAVQIIGSGYDTTITASGVIAGAVLKLTDSYIYVANLQIDCDGNANYGIRFYGGSRCEAYRVDCENAVIDNFCFDYTSQRTGSKLKQCIAGEAGRYNVYVGADQTDNWITGCTLKDSNYAGTIAGLALDAAGTQVNDNHIWGNQYGILLAPTTTVVREVITNNYIESNTDANIYNAGTCHGAYDISITGNLFWANVDDRPEYDIQLDVANPYFSSRFTITGNTFQGQSFANYGVYLGSRGVSNTIVANTFNGYDTSSIYIGAVGNTISFNEGFITENRGTGAITSGSISDVITHLMDFTPTAGEIQVTITNNPANDFGHVWVDTITSTQFTVNCDADPGAGNLNFSWQIVRCQLET